MVFMTAATVAAPPTALTTASTTTAQRTAAASLVPAPSATRVKSLPIPHFKATALLDFSNLVSPSPQARALSMPPHVRSGSDIVECERSDENSGLDGSADASTIDINRAFVGDDQDEDDDMLEAEAAAALERARRAIEDQWRVCARTSGWLERSASADALGTGATATLRARTGGSGRGSGGRSNVDAHSLTPKRVSIGRSTLSEPVLSAEKAQRHRQRAAGGARNDDEDDDDEDAYDEDEEYDDGRGRDVRGGFGA
jgi:hypothetical protein